jgi:hypothetical protein
MRKRWLLLLALIAGLWFLVGAYFVIVPVASWWVTPDLTPAYTEMLLAGGKSITLRSLRLSAKGQQVLIDDPEVVDYINEAARTATHEGTIPTHEGGGRISADFQFQDWTRERYTCRLPDDADGLTIELDPLEPGGEKWYYWIEFKAPLPAALGEALKQLR